MATGVDTSPFFLWPLHYGDRSPAHTRTTDCHADSAKRLCCLEQKRCSGRQLGDGLVNTMSRVERSGQSPGVVGGLRWPKAILSRHKPLHPPQVILSESQSSLDPDVRHPDQFIPADRVHGVAHMPHSPP